MILKSQLNQQKKKKLKSVCGFKEVITHPLNTWYLKKNKPFQFVKNNICRRQDLPKAYSHHHYICGFDIKYLHQLNNELIFKNTFPILINKKTSKKLIEVDTRIELKKFKEISKNEKTKNKKFK